MTLSCGGLTLEVLTVGASVRRLVVDDGDGPLDVVLGYADLALYGADEGYLGATVGRFTNRLDRGRCPLDGVTYTVPANDGQNALHGGPDGWHARPWEVLEEGPDRVVLGLTSPDGDQGLPGEVTARVAYELSPAGVAISHTARTTRPTVLGMTNHAYVDLDGEGSGGVLDHTLEVRAGAYTPVRPDLVPTGEVVPVAGTPFDLRTPRRVGDVLAEDDEQLARAGGLDHNLVLDGAGMRTVARVVGASGRWLEVATDRPGLQVYSGAHFDGGVTGLGGTAYAAHAGLALETQGFPDAPNHPGFPSAVVRPGEQFSAHTTWRLGRR
ncbi:galactose mutarotase [Phycicoccus endophyticus]|uniref:Aldose 1-epimerase n=1 Tax=Phycicoccus endophyticus TaxID=1690220 RepID=A0A7G9R5F9_9MICO|nr:galactose mutarotase [Phycicoccus endophyticus]QNN50834.1 galactose mutarotase [Phycicoccus endophyticus]